MVLITLMCERKNTLYILFYSGWENITQIDLELDFSFIHWVSIDFFTLLVIHLVLVYFSDLRHSLFVKQQFR